MEKQEILAAHDVKMVDLGRNILRYRFKDRQLFRQSLTHKSFINEYGEADDGHYERLEFLGDAVLDLVVSEIIMNRYPDFQEGELSRLRASFVNEGALAVAARELHLGDYLLIGKGEEATGGREKESILADVMEAIIGAVYLDGGLSASTAVIPRLIPKILTDTIEEGVAKDFKSMIQEYVQKRWHIKPQYRLVKEEGPDHQKNFTVELAINGEVKGRGKGRSKKEAEQRAAEAAWSLMNDEAGGDEY